MDPRRLVILVLLALGLTAAPAQAAVRLDKVGDFDQPVYVAGAPGDYGRLYVVEKSGTIRVVRGRTKLATPFVDLTGLVSDVSERGLLSVAFRPDFQRSRLLYVYYNETDGDVRVDELRASSPDRADAGYRRKVIEVDHPSPTNHNGGTAMFGRDGFLYLAPGDGGSGESANAQDLNLLLGKVLRIDPIPGGGYRIPPGNPFAGATAGRDEIWSYGLRNPFRFTVDRGTGDLAIADVGQGTTEEIDYAPAAAGAGRAANFGWDTCEGSFLTGSETAPCTFGTRPVIDRFASDGWHSIVAGYVVRDPSLPSLRGRLLYGDVSLGEVHSALPRLPKAQDSRHLLDLPAVTSFGLDAAGCIYATSLDGPLYRLVETSTAVPCPAPPAVRVPDRTPPGLRTRVPRRQRVLRRRGVIAYARSTELGTVALAATLRIGRRSYRLRYTRRRAAPGVRVRLAARLTRRGYRALRRALRRHRRARVRVALRARDAVGNRSPLSRRSVRVRR
jgi:glucose/arabinose dehydrogenase